MSWWARLYIYGLHGVTMEVLYTAIWEVTRLNFKAIGFSSIWAVFMYATGLFGIEQIFVRFAYKYNFLIRGTLYALWIYLVELTCGVLLELYDAKPWDYKLFAMNYGGFITLEYAPMWFILGIATEMIIVKIVLNTQYAPYNDTHPHLPAHVLSVSFRSFVVVTPAIVALLAYVYFYVVAAYNNGEYFKKPENDLYQSI